MKKQIYMVQANSQYGSSVYYPYAAGSLIAYAFRDDAVRNGYSFGGFIYKKTDIKSAVAKLNKPFLVGFSCYVWNYEYNKMLASELKRLYPECITVFGGHQVDEKSDVIDMGIADFVMLGEGEENFKKLLIALADGGDITSIPNLIYNADSGAVFTGEAHIEIPERVSPYTEGYFDSITQQEQLCFSAILETNRGCPNRCAFCDWGNEKAYIRRYERKTVESEIDWMAAHKIEYCYCADSNFGMFEEDIETVRYIIKKHNETGFPEKFQATYSKNNPDRVFMLNKMLNEAGMSKGATLSFQSLSPLVLENIYRKNMPLESFRELMTMYNTGHIASYSEIIIGLPGESYNSFADGIEKLLEYGQHMSVNFFNCELLTNSIMSKREYIERYKIESVLTEQHQYHTMPDTKLVKEFSRIVVATDTMSREDWARCNIFSVFIRAFHNLGLLQCFAILLHHERGVKYRSFYEGLLKWAQDNPCTVAGHMLIWLREKYSEVLDGTGSLTYFDDSFGKLVWPLDESAFLKVIEQYDRFYSEVTPFLKSFFDGELFENLLKYQRATVKTPYTKKSVIELQYDLYEYFTAVYRGEKGELVKCDNTICISSPEVPGTLPDYASQTLWYGRKGGQNIITNVTYVRKAVKK